MSSSVVAQMPPGTEAAIEFGPFHFDPVRREIVDENGPLHIGSRALQILEVLLEAPGRLYSREELVERVWPRTVVEETSLRVHMSALRRLLGDGIDGARYIANVPGRGYSFVGEVRKVSAGGAPIPMAPPLAATLSTIPSRLTRTISEDPMLDIYTLVAKMQAMPKRRIAEVEDFVDFLTLRRSPRNAKPLPNAEEKTPCHCEPVIVSTEQAGQLEGSE